MAALPPLQSLQIEHLLDKSGSLDPSKLLKGINDFMGATYGALNQGIRLTQNAGMAIATARFVVPEYPWTAVSSFGTNYSNKGGSYPSAEYLIWPGGRCFLRGGLTKSVAQATLETMANLPAEATPDKAYEFAGLAGTAYGPYTFEIDTSGHITNVDSTKSGTLATINCDYYLGATAATPKPFSGGEWPIIVKHGLSRCTGVVPISAEVVNGDPRTDTVGQYTLDWKDKGDGQLVIRSAYGLQPGKTYSIRLLCLSE